MKRIYCDICKEEYEGDKYIEADFATIEGQEIRLFSDGDICKSCWNKLQKHVYSAIKTHVFNNIKVIGNWNEWEKS